MGSVPTDVRYIARDGRWHLGFVAAVLLATLMLLGCNRESIPRAIQWYRDEASAIDYWHRWKLVLHKGREHQDLKDALATPLP